MKHIKTLNTQTLNHTVKKGGCGECQTSCQSACKTSCTVGNQSCEKGSDESRCLMLVLRESYKIQKVRYWCDTSVSE